MRLMVGALLAAAAVAQSWTPQSSGTTASLRGLSALSATLVWASGSNGTFLQTTNGGANWHAGRVESAADADFRAVRAFDENTAYLLSIGNGEKSRVYKTSDGGTRWDLLYTNPDPKGFFDALAFWDALHGIILGDPVNGRFTVLTTSDGGVTWKSQKGPAASAEEGAFAASNSCLIVRGGHEAWFGTGGGRVFHSTDGGETWSAARTPLEHGATAGIFSLAFSNGPRGVAVGGDYKKTAAATGNAAVSADGGKSWTAPTTPPAGYRSAVAYVADRKMWIATGTSGSDISLDDGKTWKQFDTGDFNALGFVSSDAGWAVGPKGAIARFKQ
jgi:photosystem II stability/assembly factor-like uncharacterized protein